MKAFLAALAAASALSAPAWAADTLRAQADAARERGLHDPTAYAVVSSISTDVGERLAGTEAAARARDWGVATLKRLGFSNVHVEPFPITAWIRGRESASTTAPHPQSLGIIGLGGSVSTAPDGVETDAVVFKTYADLLAAAPGSLSGKIAIVTQGMARTQEGTGYGAANPLRRSGPSEAARRGAVAYLVRSLSTAVSREPHTGALNYAADAPKIPAAALSVIDAQLIDRLADSGAPIRIRLNLQSSTAPATGWTVVGDLPGTEHPDQMIVLGGHLDSWDPGTGSIDDGAGVAIAVGAAYAAAGHQQLKRTIRVAMFGAEEMDFANAAFTEAHKAEVPNIVAIGEIDEGADNVWKVELPAGALDLPETKTLAAALAPLNIYISPDAAKGSGSDVRGLIAAGAPPIAFHQDASRYFDWHHSSEDTLDKIDPAQLNQNVAAWAAFLTIVGNSDVRFTSTAPAAKP